MIALPNLRIPLLSGLIYLLLGTIPAYAQENGVLRGRVLDATTHQPIGFCTVQLGRTGRGTASNSQGEFGLPIQAENRDSLRISALGYRLQVIAPSGFGSAAKVLTVLMDPLPLEIAEVKVTGESASVILKRAVRRIPENYLVRPHVLSGFYRNTTRAADTLLEFSEAAFEIYRFARGAREAGRMKLLKARDVKNERDFKNIQLGQSPSGVMNADVVLQIASSPILSAAGFANHEFRIRRQVIYQGRSAWEITFRERPGAKAERLYRGKILVDRESDAFLYFDYGLCPASIAAYKIGDTPTRMLMKLMGIKIQLLTDSLRAAYRPFGNRWVLSSVVDRAGLLIRTSRNAREMRAETSLTYLVTSVDSTVTQPFEQQLNPRSMIEDHDSDPSDVFWKDYSILLPEFDSGQAIAKINAINQALDLKAEASEMLKKWPKEPAARIDSLLAFYHRNGQFTGTVLVSNPAGTILSKSYGYAQRDNMVSADGNTAYRIGSLAKSFTAVIIAQLENEGKLDYEAPVSTYLPGYVHRQVNIAQLLSHRSGIPNLTANTLYKTQLLEKSIPLAEVVTRFCSDPLQFAPGTHFDYSNSNFIVLALVAEKLCGKSFAELLHERIFSPLGMTHSFASSEVPAPVAMAVGYLNDVAEHAYPAGNLAGAGGIYSSANDLLRFHGALMTERLLPKSKRERLFQQVSEFQEYKAGYGYGWMIDRGAFSASKKHRIIYHPGTDLGFFTMFVRQPDTGNCIVLLSNNGDFPRYDLSDEILRILNN